MTTARRIARLLLDIQAVKLSPDQPFTWASGLRSPIYCDNRIILSHPDARRAVTQGFQELMEAFQEQAQGIAGVATAGIPHGTLVADRLGLPFIYVRSKAKEHGRQNQIEGELVSGHHYVLVEDLISTGGSVLHAAEALKGAGGIPLAALAIFTYEFPSAQRNFRAADLPYATLSNYGILLEEALTGGHLSDEQHARLAEWRADPHAWSEQFTADNN